MRQDAENFSAISLTDAACGTRALLSKFSLRAAYKTERETVRREPPFKCNLFTTYILPSPVFGRFWAAATLAFFVVCSELIRLFFCMAPSSSFEIWPRGMFILMQEACQTVCL